ncbi:MAG: glycosyl hydrolase [Pirellulaceae bacterium]
MQRMSLRTLGTLLLATLLYAAASTAATAQEADELAGLRAQFVSPPSSAGTVTLYWLNGLITKEGIREQMRALRDQCGFGGVAPLTFHAMNPATQPAYLSEEYFDIYGCILDTAKELGMTVVFYDDCDFPSGSAGDQMRTLHPDSLLKYLARGCARVTGPAEAVIPVPAGVLMSVVARNLDDGSRQVVTEQASWADGPSATAGTNAESPQSVEEAGRKTVRWNVPAGHWEVQAFVCATAPNTRWVDYLDPQAVRQFIELTYDQFYRRFPQHFGSTIRMTFFDDLAAMNTPDCLMWTPSFRDKFQQRFGRSAEPFYPALWEDIGPDTGAARVALYSVRNEMFAAGYPEVSEAWCAQHGIKSSGHPAASYNPNPLQAPGDAMLFYKHQSYPLTDYIHYYHHGVDGFKVPASAAYNFDQPILVCEIYGNFHQTLPNDSRMLYRAGMECYARGVNYLLPHGTWWDPAKMAIVPEISWRNPDIGPELPRFNQWAARCETLLRGGRHVADIGVLYPIADLESRYCVSEQKPNWGYAPVPGTDYFEIMRLLTGEIRRDFTLLHPETLDNRCRVDGAELLLDNRENWERFKVLLLPACRTVYLSNLQQVKRFYDAGGKVVATTCLPEHSAEFGHDSEVRELTQAMFGPSGHGILVTKPDERSLEQALDGLGLVWDVRVEHAPEIPRVSRDGSDPYVNQSASNPEWYEGGNRQFAYIHKVQGSASLYFFANSSAQKITADVTLRGRLPLEAWDPHTGVLSPVEFVHDTSADTEVTRLKVALEPLKTVFFVAPSRDPLAKH